MFDMDEVTKTVFEDVRNGVPIVGSHYLSQMDHLDHASATNGPIEHQHFQRSFLPTSTPDTGSSNTMFVPEGNEHLFWGSNVSPNVSQRPERHTTHPHAAAFPDCMAPNNVSVPPPLIIHRNRRTEEADPSWHVSGYAREDGIGFPRTREYTEGNALRLETNSTRTTDYEEIFLGASSVPVAERLSARGLWPMMTSITAPATSTQFNPAPISTTGYGLGFSSQPSSMDERFHPGLPQGTSWATTQQAPWHPAQARLDETSFQAAGSSSTMLPWTYNAAWESDFPSDPTPSTSTGYPSFASTAERPFNQGLWMPSQVPQAGATYPPPLPILVAEPSFDEASQESSLSASAPSLSNTQMPYFLAKVKCHLCREDFRRGSELHEHCRTNKHRLRELQAENPGVVVTAAHLIPDCFCPSCGKGYATPYNVTRHLKTCRGRIESRQSGSQD